jgi:ribonuclease P protein component
MPVPNEIAPDAQAVDASRGLGFPRSDRLLRRSEFMRVQQRGRRVHLAHFVMLLMRGRPPRRGQGQDPDQDSQHTRLGVTAGRRVGGAVQRNRIKRVVREVFRRNRALFPRECDVVLVARTGADRLDYAAVLGELERAQTAIERAVRQLLSEPIQSSDP